MFYVFPIVLFVSSFFFSVIVATQIADPIVSVLVYQIILLIVCYFLVQKCRRSIPSKNFILLILCLMAIVQFTLPLAYALVDGPASMIWTTDAYHHHIGNSEVISSFLTKGSSLPEFSDPYQKLFIANWWVGIWYALFGSSPYITAIATSIFRIPTCYLVYKSSLLLFKDRSYAAISLIIYSFCPSVILYTMQYYKDFFVHFLVALFIYLSVKSLSKSYYLVFCLVPIGFLFVDRFYLALILAFVLAVLITFSRVQLVYKIISIVIAVSMSLLYLSKYLPNGDLFSVIDLVFTFQDAHNSDSSVRPTSNFLIDFFRASFTPFFSMAKVENYIWFDSLLVFGGFIHQFIMLLYIRSLWLYRNFKQLLMLNLSVLMLLILVSLIFPYNGRARDSVYPLIAITASLGIPLSSKRPKPSIGF